MLHKLRARFRPRRIAVAILGTIIMLGFTHVPPYLVPGALSLDISDKLQHAIAYALITTLFVFALREPRRAGTFLVILAVFVLIGALDEMTQPLVGRDAELLDFGADLLGVAVALMFCFLSISVRSRKRATISDSIEQPSSVLH